MCWNDLRTIGLSFFWSRDGTRSNCAVRVYRGLWIALLGEGGSLKAIQMVTMPLVEVTRQRRCGVSPS